MPPFAGTTILKRPAGSDRVLERVLEPSSTQTSAPPTAVPSDRRTVPETCSTWGDRDDWDPQPVPERASATSAQFKSFMIRFFLWAGSRDSGNGGGQPRGFGLWLTATAYQR